MSEEQLTLITQSSSVEILFIQYEKTNADFDSTLIYLITYFNLSQKSKPFEIEKLCHYICLSLNVEVGVQKYLAGTHCTPGKCKTRPHFTQTQHCRSEVSQSSVVCWCLSGAPAEREY